MSLQLILGSSGAGKSYELYKTIIKQSINSPENNYIVIVPEQFTMQIQKDIISMHPNHGVINIDILSFTRLAYRVFEEVGGYNRIILEDIGKSMVIRKVVEQKKKELGIFGGSIKKTGFINELKSLLSELYTYNIDNQRLLEAINITKNKPLLNNKMKDVLTVYNGFKEFLSDKFITSEEILDILSININKSDIIKNSIVCIDSFVGFTPCQYKLIEEIMKYSKQLKIALTIDPYENIYEVEEEFKLFCTTQKAISKLIDTAKTISIIREKDIIINNPIPYRFRENPSLASLEKNLFRYTYKPFKNKQDNISIHINKNPNEEVEYVCREILNLVRDKNYRYKDIAVITGDINTYCNIIDKIFLKNNIPCFIDYKRSVLSNPFVELIRSVMEVIIKDFSYESIFRYLRCGLTGINREDIDKIENYVLALGIRGNKSWQSEWTKKYKDSEEIDLDYINNIRQNIISPIIQLRNTLKNKNYNVRMYSTALWEFISYLEIERQLNDYKNKFAKEKELVLLKQYEQIYKMVLNLLDKIVELLGNDVISIQEYSGILDAGFEEAKMGIIPLGIDQILVGDIERTRLKDVKALFFIGVNDGIIPKTNSASGIISDIDKQILNENGIEMSPTSRQHAYTEKFYLYLNMTKPSEKLYISFSKVGLNGKSLRASYIVGIIMKLFPNIDVIDEEIVKNDINLISTDNLTLKYLIDGIREYKNKEMSTYWKETFSWYLNNPIWKDRLYNFINASYYTNQESVLSKSVSNALYGSELINSVTRLEKYAGCAYAQFLAYGLQVQERQKYTFSSPDMGSIFHNTIELFSKKLVQYNQKWDLISDEQRDKLVEDCVNEISLDYKNKILKDSAKNEYMINRISRITKRTIWALQQQIKKGSFIPSNYEIQFSEIEDLNSINIALSEDEKIRLKGRIDRLDKYEDDKNVYLKIIDYKSGSSEFDMISLYYGLQLQLVVYMNMAIELEKKTNKDKNVIPAGIFYYNIDDPVVDRKSGLLFEEINDLILKQLKMNGLVNCDPKIIKLIDKDFDGESDVMDIKLTRKGEISSSASQKQFESLSKYVNKKIVQFGKEILDGNIEINPYKMKEKNACTYCKYSSICCFDTSIDGNNYKRFKCYNIEKIWEFIEQDSKEVNNDGNQLDR